MISSQLISSIGLLISYKNMFKNISSRVDGYYCCDCLDILSDNTLITHHIDLIGSVVFNKKKFEQVLNYVKLYFTP